MRSTPAVFLLLTAATLTAASVCQPRLLAQEPTPAPDAEALAAGRDKLHKALSKAASTTDTAFTVKWSDATQKNGNKDAMVVFLGNKASVNGTMHGSWHEQLMHLVNTENGKDELLLAGRRMLAKDSKTDWVLRAGRYADGSETDFLPDVLLLLQQLASWDLALVQRNVGSLDDRPIEIFSVTLNPDQVTELTWSGLLPNAMVTGANPFAQFIRMQGAGNNRPAPAKPEATVDLALFIDPATATVHELRFRSWTKQDPRFVGAAGGGAVVVRAGAVQQLGQDEAEEEEEEDDAAGNAAAPLRYVDGLPERKRSKMTVRDYVVKLTDHGRTAAPTLTEEQRKRLGLAPH